jgi:hypothetical protein
MTVVEARKALSYLRPKFPKLNDLIRFRNNRNRISSFGQEVSAASGITSKTMTKARSQSAHPRIRYANSPEETPKTSKRSHGATRHCLNRATASARGSLPSRASWRYRSCRGQSCDLRQGARAARAADTASRARRRRTGRRTTASRARWWCKVR